VQPTAPASAQSPAGTPFTSPRNTLASASGVVIALGDSAVPPWAQDHHGAGAGAGVLAREKEREKEAARDGAGAGAGGGALPFDEEAKLVYGIVLSLRNMVRRLSGR
jgi:hypothetical protein